MEADLSAELPHEALVGTGLSLHPMETEVGSAWSRARRVKQRDEEEG